MSEARKISLAIVERKQLMFKNRYPGCFSIKIYFHKRKEEKPLRIIIIIIIIVTGGRGYTFLFQMGPKTIF
jgi:hypothetical protein